MALAQPMMLAVVMVVLVPFDFCGFAPSGAFLNYGFFMFDYIVLIFQFVFVLALISLIFRVVSLENELSSERQRHGNFLKMVIPFLESLPKKDRLELKRKIAQSRLDNGEIENFTDSFPVLTELDVPKGQHTLLVGGPASGKTNAINNWLTRINAHHVNVENFSTTDFSKAENLIFELSFSEKDSVFTVDSFKGTLIKSIIDHVCIKNDKHLFVIIDPIGHLLNSEFFDFVLSILNNHNKNITFVFVANFKEEIELVQPFCKTYCFKCFDSSFFPIEILTLKQSQFLDCDYLFYKD